MTTSSESSSSAPSMGAGTTSDPVSPTDPAGAEILVVDDNEANRSLARNTLEDEGYTVREANNGAEAVESFKAARPDCVLLDVRMPEVDGFAACEQIRGLPGGDETPIIFLTALRDVDTFDHALKAGADDFLTKPVRPTELVVRVQAALKLRQLRSELREHYALLRHQRDALLRVQLQKERLMAFVVHDLKNPVNSMDLHAQLLLRVAGLPDDARDSVQQIRAEARVLTRMILNLLDLSKGDEGKLVARKVNLNVATLINEVVQELGVAARAKGVAIEAPQAAVSTQADPDLLRRLVANLVENSIRHAPRGTTVTISAESADGGVQLMVRDRGKGVPESMRERIFDPFVQAEETSSGRAVGGRGLGLAFCKLAADAHDGKLWVTDAAPGAAFCLHLPA
jgi:two-component system sensor histidine kinase/response regulator